MYPVNMDVISWLGAYHVKHEVRARTTQAWRGLDASLLFTCCASNSLQGGHLLRHSAILFGVVFVTSPQVYEKAMPYFDLASKVQPQEVKWALMVASCYRRIGAFPQVCFLAPKTCAGTARSSHSSLLNLLLLHARHHHRRRWRSTRRSTRAIPTTSSACATWCTSAPSWAGATTRSAS